MIPMAEDALTQVGDTERIDSPAYIHPKESSSSFLLSAFNSLNPLTRFRAMYLSHYCTEVIPPFHVEIDGNLLDSGNMRLVIDAGRGSAKSTVAVIGFVLYELCVGDYSEIQIISQSGGSKGLSTKWLGKIKTEIAENQLLIRDYGIRPGPVWQGEYIKVLRGGDKVIEIWSRGKNASIRGSRGLVIIDDPQDIRDVRSETVLANDEDWFLQDILPVLMKDQRLIFIGSGISPISLLSKAKRIPGWKTLEYPAINSEGESIWPEMWPIEELRKRRLEMGEDRFAAEYLCRPMVSGNPVFRPEWFQEYDPENPLFRQVKEDGMYVVTAVDTAESQSEQSDYTAIVTIGATKKNGGEYYILDARHWHWTPRESASQLFVIKNLFKQNITIVESRVKYPYVDPFLEMVGETERLYRDSLNIKQIKPYKDKVLRAYTVQGLFQQGKVFYNPQDRFQREMKDEAMMFTGFQNYHDDYVDAMVYALGEAKVYATGGADINSESEAGIPASGKKYNLIFDMYGGS
jgi:predicted phage terminase large subunit-like protein